MSLAMPSRPGSSDVIRPSRMCGKRQLGSGPPPLVGSLATPSIRPTTSSGVTPRSNEMRSTLLASRRSIRSFMPLLAFGQRRIGDDELVVDDADGDRRLLLLERLERGEEALDVAPEQRVIGGVELRRPGAGSEAAEQFLVEGQAAGGFGGHAVMPLLRALLWRRRARRARRSPPPHAGHPSRRPCRCGGARGPRPLPYFRLAKMVHQCPVCSATLRASIASTPPYAPRASIAVR